MLKFDCSSGILHSTPNQFEYIDFFHRNHILFSPTDPTIIAVGKKGIYRVSLEDEGMIGIKEVSSVGYDKGLIKKTPWIELME